MLITLSVFGQQDPQWTLLNDENPLVNPSTMVNDYRVNAQARFREQWAGFDGNPLQAGFNVFGTIDTAMSAIGMSGLWGRIGAESFASFKVNYAFDGRIGEHHIIPGIQLGFVFRELDGTLLDPIQGGDPNIPNSVSSDFIFDLGLSFLYRFRGISAGFSTTHLTEGEIELETVSQSKVYTIARHFYGHFSYDIGLGRYFRIKPIAFVQSDAASTQFESIFWFGPRNLHKYIYSVSTGVGFRLNDAWTFAAEIRFPWFSAGYSYDHTVSSLRNYSNGTHEVYLRMHLFRNTGPARDWG